MDVSQSGFILISYSAETLWLALFGSINPAVDMYDVWLLLIPSRLGY